MRSSDTPLAGLKLIELRLHADARGFFTERFNAQRYGAHGLPEHFVQDNHSRSLPGVLRGLHYQNTPAQGKLVGVIHGRVWDVAVDIRPGSATFGQHYAVELSGDNGRMLWIPEGFAHGFCVLSQAPADMVYKVTTPYNPQGEGAIRDDDPALAIDWPLKEPLISERDQNLPSWEEYTTGIAK